MVARRLTTFINPWTCFRSLCGFLPVPHDNRRQPLSTGCADSPHEADPQSDFPGGRSRHPVPARDQGDAEGDADGGRPAADPACRGRGARGRHRASDLRHRPQQVGDRGSFRPPIRARGHAQGAPQEERAETARRRHARAPAPRASPASNRRSASATRSGARANWSATSLSRCCCRTCWCRTSPAVWRRWSRPMASRRARPTSSRSRKCRWSACTCTASSASARIPARTPAKLADHQHGREAQARGRTVQSLDHRPLHPAAGNLRHSGKPADRRRRRNPAHRRDDHACRRRSPSTP